jgi:hypothetical protein
MPSKDQKACHGLSSQEKIVQWLQIQRSDLHAD